MLLYFSKRYFVHIINLGHYSTDIVPNKLTDNFNPHPNVPKLNEAIITVHNCDQGGEDEDQDDVDYDTNHGLNGYCKTTVV